jgi:fructokinase
MKALGVGELLWDFLPMGPRLGGAPFNVIAHLAKLGCDVGYFTAVGEDELGMRALDEACRLQVDPAFIQKVALPTGTVRVHLEGDGVPEYEIASPAAYEALSPVELEGRFREFEILVFGTLAQRSPGTASITRSLAAMRPEAMRLYDLNFRRGCWTLPLVEELMTLATVVKMNEKEASILADLMSLDPDSTESLSRSLAERFGLNGVCVTRGPRGAVLLTNGTYCEAMALPVEVVDTVGAGDALSAGLAFGIASGWPPEQVLDLGMRLAALVAARRGAIPDWSPAELGIAIVPGSPRSAFA